MPLVLSPTPTPGQEASAARGHGSFPSATHLVAAAGEARVPLGQDALHPQEEGALDLVLWEKGAEGGAGRETGGGAGPRSLPWLTGEKPKADCDGPHCVAGTSLPYPEQSESDKADEP